MKIKSLVIAMSLATVSGLAWAGDYNAEAASVSSTSTAADNSMYQDTINSMNQVTDRKAANLGLDWTKYVSVHGGLFVDGVWGAKSQNFVGENSKALSVTNGYMSVEATPNDWTKFDMTANYSDASSSYSTGSDQTAYVDQVYATFGNSDKYPVFVQLGRQYAPFGRYDLYPTVKSLGQVLTQTNQTEAQLGFVVPQGLYGSVYTFQNGVQQDQADGTKPYNWGGLVGFKKANDRMSVDLGVGYMSNMTGVQAIQDYVTNAGAYSDNTSGQGYYNSSVGAMAPYVTFKTGPFGVDLDYVAALDRFNKATLPYETSSSDGAKPTAFDANVSYDFNKRDMDQQVFVGYQKSTQSSALDIPKDRYAAGYNVYPWTNVMFGAEIDRDNEYGSGNAGNNSQGETYYIYNLRAGVQF